MHHTTQYLGQVCLGDQDYHRLRGAYFQAFFDKNYELRLIKMDQTPDWIEIIEMMPKSFSDKNFYHPAC
jgi:hypothetical protein